MRSRIGLILPAVFLLAACAGKGPTPTPIEAPVQPSAATEQVSPTPAQVTPASTASEVTPVETGAANCATEDANKIGESITKSYPFTSPEEVMTWFCQGAEFEDILTALETEEVNGTAAEDMLLMRAEGLTWEEIWEVVGFNRK